MKKRAQKKVKHKPNARHTLSEVLHSLQDMMNNELASIADNNTGNPSANATATLSKEDVMNTLKALISDVATVDNNLDYPSLSETEDKGINEVEPGIADSTDQLSQQASHEELVIEEEATANQSTSEVDVTLESPKENAKSKSNNTKAGHDAATRASLAEDFRLEIEVPRVAERSVDDKSTEAVANKEIPVLTDKTAVSDAGEQTELNWDDIPVLHEVVAPPPEPDSHSTREAREIAVKVAAALNIETRKKGGDSLDIKTIMRLQSLLKQELQDRQNDDDLDK